MDYTDIMDLMYIANNEVWFNPANRNVYGDKAIAASNDTWERFWELVRLNGGDGEEGFIWDNLRQFGSVRSGANWYAYTDTYPDWLDSAAAVLADAGYPMYIEQLRKYDMELAGDSAYMEWLDAMNRRMSELYRIYNV